MKTLPSIETSGGLFLLDASPLIAGDSRFLIDLILPLKARHRRRVFREALARSVSRSGRSLGAAGLADRGRLHRILGAPQKAAADFKAALAKDPRCARALAFRAEMTMIVDPPRAVRDFAKASAWDPKDPVIHLWKGYGLLLSGDEPSARQALDLSLEIAPRTAASRFLRAILRDRGGDLSGADADLSEAITAFPGSPGLHTLRADVRSRAGRLEDAVADAHRAITLHPENIDGFVRILYHLEGTRAAVDKTAENRILLKATERIIKKDPGCAWVLAARATLLGRADLQVAPLRESVKLDPSMAWVRAFLGRALSGGARKADPKKARLGLKELDRAVRLAPEAGWIRTWRAEVLKIFGKKALALKDLDSGISLGPDYPLGFAWRASLRAQMGDKSGAVEDISVCLDVLSRPSLMRQRSLLLWDMGDRYEALKDLTRCTEASAAHALAYSGMEWLVMAKTTGDYPGHGMIATARAEIKALLGADTPSKKKVEDLVHRSRYCELLLPPRYLALTTAGLEVLDGAHPGDPMTTAWFGRTLLDKGKTKEAIARFDMALRLDPRFIQAYVWRAQAWICAGDPGRALKDLERARAQRSTYLPAVFCESALRLKQGQRAAGLGLLVTACRSSPFDSRFILAWSFRARAVPRRRSPRRIDEALLEAELDLLAGRFRRVQRLLDPHAPKALGALGCVVRGLARIQNGHTGPGEEDLGNSAKTAAAETRDALSRLIKVAPGLRPAVLGAAYFTLWRLQRLTDRKEADRILSIAMEIAAKAPADAESSLLPLLRSEGARRAGNLKMALSQSDRAVAARPRSAAARLIRAKARLRAGDLRGAQADALKAVSLDPRDSEGHAWLAEAYRAQGRLTQARTSVRRAIAKDGAYAWAIGLRGELHRAAGRREKALADLRAAVELDPQCHTAIEVLGEERSRLAPDRPSAWIYAWRGGVHRRHGRLDRALQGLDLAVELDSSCFWAWGWRGELKIAMGDHSGGLEDLDRALSDHPDYGECRVWRGKALCHDLRYEDALKDFEHALSLDRDSVWALIGAAACREKMGDAVKAGRHIERARRLAPGLFK